MLNLCTKVKYMNIRLLNFPEKKTTISFQTNFQTEVSKMLLNLRPSICGKASVSHQQNQ